MRTARGRCGRAAGPVVVGLLALATALPASAQETSPGEIVGTVIEAGTGRVIAAATVTLEARTAALPDGATEGTDRTTSTDAHGRYRFADLAPGWYDLRVEALGYRHAALQVELPSSWRIRRSLGLEISPVALRSLEVSIPHSEVWADDPAERRAAGAAASAFGTAIARPTLDARALTPADVEKLAAFGEPDVLRALQHLPGVSSQGDYSAGVWTRGAAWGLTQVMLDGLPLYHPLHLGGTASGMSADGLEAVLFLPGARPAALSEGAAGVVNLVTRTAGDDLEVGGGISPIAMRAHVRGRWLDDRVGVSVTGRRSWWDIVSPPRLLAGDAASGEVDYWFGDVVGRVDVRVSERLRVEAGGLWEEDRVDGDIPELVAASRGRWGNALGWAAVAGAWDGVRVRLSFGRTVHSTETRSLPWVTFYSPDGTVTLDMLDLRIARTTARLELGGVGPAGIEWQAGVDRSVETLAQRGADAEDREAPGVAEPTSVGWTRLWGQGTVRAGPATVSAGVVRDLPQEGDPEGLGFLPNAAVRVAAHERLTLEVARGMGRQFTWPFARAGRSFGPGLGVDHVWMTAGDGRSPLTSDVTTLGGELRLDGGFGLGLTGWWRSVDGLSLSGVATVDDGELQPPFEHGEEGVERARGVEATLWRRTGRVRGEVSYSRGRARIHGPDGRVWAPPSDRRHSVDVAAFAFVLPTLRVGGTFRSESGWPFAMGPWSCPPDDESVTPADCDVEVGDPLRPEEHTVLRAPWYQSVDLLLDWTRPGKSITWGVSLSLKNALGRDNKSAFRPQGCSGAELIAVACEGPVGVGLLGDGLTKPTPAIAVRVLF